MRLLATGVCLVVAAALLGLWVSGASSASQDRCARFQQAATTRLGQDVGDGPRVVVVGDSWSAGLGLARAGDSWPSHLDARVHVAGFSGSGFSARASTCGRVSFADRAGVALRDGADLVVVQGGLNDTDRPAAELRAGFEHLVRVVGDRPLLVVGPAAAPARAAGVARVDALLADLAARHGASYLPTSGLDLPYLEDRLHLTLAGHAAFGDEVAATVARLLDAP